MPVYECKVSDSDKSRLVKATSAAVARSHIVQAKPITAERMAELIEDGVELEKAAAPAAENSSSGEED